MINQKQHMNLNLLNIHKRKNQITSTELEQIEKAKKLQQQL
jgi:hypothetical protein